MVPITVPIPGTILPAAPPRSAPEIVRFLSAQALVRSHRSAGLVSAGLVSAGLVLAGLVLSFMLLPSVFWKSAWMLAHPPHRRDVAVRPAHGEHTARSLRRSALRPRFAPGPFSFENCCHRSLRRGGPPRGHQRPRFAERLLWNVAPRPPG